MNRAGTGLAPFGIHMLAAPDLARAPHLLPICRLLHDAEELAARCSARQAVLARPWPALHRRLVAQEGHEAAHVALFAAVLRASPPPESGELGPALAALHAYGARLDAALARGDLAASLIGLQGVLEGVGTSLLRTFDAAPVLRALCRLLLLQESGHHRLGLDMLATLDHEKANVAAVEYCAAARVLLEASAPLLERAGVAAATIDPRQSLARS